MKQEEDFMERFGPKENHLHLREYARTRPKVNLYSFAIGKKDGTWKEEFVESDSVVGAQSKIYNMYPNEENPDITFRVFLSAVQMEDFYVS